jgi:hypothetical protein
MSEYSVFKWFGVGPTKSKTPSPIISELRIKKDYHVILQKL